MDNAIMTEVSAAADSVQPAHVDQRPDDWPIRPALFARYADLADLRYDYPMVLIDGDGHSPAFRPLKQIMNEILAACAAPGSAGEAMRQRGLALEHAIRRRVAKGERGLLSDLWRNAADALIKTSGEGRFGPMDSDFDRARDALDIDGQVIGCDAVTPVAVVRHVWHAEHNHRARAFRKKVDGLLLGLSNIIKADYAKSEDSHVPDQLRGAVGATDRDVLDFFTLSRMLERQHPERRLSAERRRRIEWAMLVLNSQRFFEPGRSSQRPLGAHDPHRYIFDSTSAALDAFRKRLPETLEFIKALTVAELEVENRYVPEVYDPVLERFDESDLTDEQMSHLPVPLVCLQDGKSGNAEIVRAFEALASGLPFKVLIQSDDILGDTTPEPPEGAFGGGSARLAAMAMGLNDTFVLQVSSAHLSGMAAQLDRALRYDGPGLVCIYSGATATVPDVAPYLLAAAATESRAFPSFSYDPSAGPDWARRFDLAGNPQPGKDWPRHPVDYEDRDGQRRGAETRFGAADFIMADTRYRRFCTPRPASGGADGLVPAADWLDLAREDREGLAAFAPGLDPDNRLYHVVLDEKIVSRAREARQAWHNLQELAGINNSHVERALADARLSRTEVDQEPAPKLDTTTAPTATGRMPEADAGAQPQAIAETADEPDAETGAAAEGLPWIETSRCTTCNECTQISGALFAYNEDSQAYIADPTAGTYRELVEAAESCQVSIIHPGRPLNPDEPDLEELIERALPFD